MKKLFFAAIALSIVSLSACHYGQDEAKQTLERNEQYKSEKADYSINRAGEGGQSSSTTEEAAPAPVADSTAAAH